MKKIILFTLTLLLLSDYCLSQNQSQSKYNFGIEGGPNWSVMYGDKIITDNYTPGISFTGGIFFQVNFTDIISVRTSLSFDRKNFKGSRDVMFTENNGDEIGLGSFYSNFDYLVLPVLFRVNIGKSFNIFANAGPYIGYLIQAKSFGKINATGDTFNRKYDNAQSLDLGVSAGIGCSIPLGNHFNISVEFRDNIGLLPVLKEGSNSAKFNSTYGVIGLSY